ncbi:MAG TPA: polyprenyl diphosphate synthase [Candidatus Acidoferrum sp.]|nr:polyprenyl diphosphate synthase [Candidatus Acidoferrum sp.]
MTAHAADAHHRLPRHIAIIMDGNNRWMKQQGGSGLSGHRAGVEAARRTITLCAQRGIECLTLFAFSSENWQRPRREVSGLMTLFANFLQASEIKKLHKNNIRLRFIGRRDRFDNKLRALIEKAEKLTHDNTGMTLLVAADYGGRWDITQAAQKLAEQVRQGQLAPADFTEQLLQQHTEACDLPPPDLCIRTGGEHRISNFLLWQFAYTELYFTPTLWPDFDEAELELALADFASRQRRYGKLSEQVEAGGRAGG